ncbi:MAG: TldD/PmbA family protein [Patescibacteria group bacterium]
MNGKSKISFKEKTTPFRTGHVGLLCDSIGVKKLLNKVLNYSKADQTEVLFFCGKNSLTRFANSQIHQNITKENAEISVRVIVDKKIGVASTNDLSDESLKKTVDSALLIAKFQKPDKDFVSLPKPTKIESLKSYVKTTADCSPEKRALLVKEAINETKKYNLKASGALSTSFSQIAVANSLGVFCYYPETLCSFSLVVLSKNSSGYADFTGLDIEKIKPKILAKEACLKAIKSKDPQEIKSGIYEVFLEEYAVSEMLGYMAYLGFTGKNIEQGKSFLSNKQGKKVLGKNITIWDDGLDKQGIPTPFDFEGAGKKKVVLIKNGVFKNRVYDSYGAYKQGKISTGHALAAPNTFGAYPCNLFMKNGKSAKAKMLKKIKKGIYVTRFWYINAHHHNLLMTGMTRDGTFLIENGRITKPIKNLRFTQSIVEALSNVSGISKETKLIGSSRVPALRIKKFNFTGQTK